MVAFTDRSARLARPRRLPSLYARRTAFPDRVASSELNTLFGNPLPTTHAEFLAFITRFAAIVSTPSSVSQATIDYLRTEGGTYDDGATLGARHLLYWLDRLLKQAKTVIGYTNRLSDAGGSWGSAAPTSLTQADPLELCVKPDGSPGVLENLLCNVAIVDFDAADDATANSRDGCVTIPRGSTSGCKTLGGLTKSYAGLGGTSSKLTANSGGTDNIYRYRFWKTLADLNEASGGNIRFPLNASRPAIVFVRNSTADHIVNVENQIGLTIASQTQCPYVLIRGYPGEWPEIWCGNSTDSDAAPNQCPNPALNPTNNTANIFVIGPNSGKYRDNVHFRGIHCHGKRETAGGDFVYAETVLSFSSFGTGHSVRHCQFTDCQPCRDDESGANVAYKDFAFSARGGDSQFSVVTSASAGFVFDSNYVQPADDNFPSPLADETDILGFTLSFNGTDQRITRNRIDGKNIRSPIRLLGATRPYVAHNYVKAPTYKAIFFPVCIAPTVEYNYIEANGTIGSDAEGLDVGEASSGTICRYNVVYVAEPIVAGTTGISINGAGDTGNITSSANSGGKVILTVPSGHGLVAGDEIILLGHSVAGYNAVRTTLAATTSTTLTTGLTYTANGVNGQWEKIELTQDVSVYGNIVYGPGIKLGYAGGLASGTVGGGAYTAAERLAYNTAIKLMVNCVVEHNVIHGFLAANGANLQAPIIVQIASTGVAGSGSMQSELGNAIRENNITRASGTNAIAVRYDHNNSDFYAADATTLDGFEDNTATTVAWADAPSGDLRITNSGPWDDWFPADMPFSPALSKAWTPN